jgi:arginine-tRNA-protein transferase
MVGAPRIDSERLELYRLWHTHQGDKRNWEINPMTGERYFHEFAFPHACVREFAYYDDSESASRLVAVGIVDETPHALSAVYTYYHPDYEKSSLGTGSILRQIDVARSLNKEWLYLGYRVLRCQSSEYKQNFHPHELLVSRPHEDAEPRWLSTED